MTARARVRRSLIIASHCVLLIPNPHPCTPSAALSHRLPSQAQPHQRFTPEIHSSDCSHTLPRHRVQRRPRCLVPSPAHPPASLDSPSPLSQHAWRLQARIPPRAPDQAKFFSAPNPAQLYSTCTLPVTASCPAAFFLPCLTLAGQSPRLLEPSILTL